MIRRAQNRTKIETKYKKRISRTKTKAVFDMSVEIFASRENGGVKLLIKFGQLETKKEQREDPLGKNDQIIKRAPKRTVWSLVGFMYLR